MSLDEAIDRALDKAEAQMAETNSVSEPVESIESPATDLAVDKAMLDKVQEQQAPEPTKKERVKDEKGRFLKTAKAEAPTPDLSDQEAEVDPTKQEQQGESPQEQTAVEAPTFWTAEQKLAFSKAPVEVQKTIADYEAQRNEWANRIATEAEKGKAYERRMSEAVKPYDLELKAQGIDPIQATERLLAWDAIFRADPRAAISDLMQKNGLSPHDFMQDETQEQYPDDPRIGEAAKRAEEALAKVTEYETRQKQAEETAFRNEVESFKNGSDSRGQVRRQFAEMYAPQISQTADIITRNYPNMPRQEVLNHAYEYTMTEIRKSFGVPQVSQPAPKQPEQIAAQAKKAQAAASSVTGAPASGSSTARPRAKTIDEALDRAEEALGLR